MRNTKPTLKMTMLAGLTAAGLVAAGSPALAETSYSFTPRVWVSQVFNAEMADDGGNSSVFMPLTGGTFTMGLEGGSALSFTALYGFGSITDEHNEHSTKLDRTLDGDSEADVTRLDLEAIWQMPLGNHGSSMYFGGRYVKSKSKSKFDKAGDAYDGKTLYDTELTYYLAEIGASTTSIIDDEGAHRLFGNLTLLAGYSEQITDDLNDTYDASDSGAVVGIDTNFGYGYTTQNMGTLSARYRLMFITDPDLDFDGGGYVNVVHGPELNWKWRF